MSVRTVVDGEEIVTTCACCNAPIYEGMGTLESTSVDLADYWYHWPIGHEGRFTIAVSLCNENETPIGGVAIVAGQVGATDVVYTVLEPDESPWTGTSVFGPILGRSWVLEDPAFSALFGVVDAIAASDDRLSSRILGAART